MKEPSNYIITYFINNITHTILSNLDFYQVLLLNDFFQVFISDPKNKTKKLSPLS